MHRKRRYDPLSRPPRPRPLPTPPQPHPQIDQHTPAIHEAFRRPGYPIERAGKVLQVTFTPNRTTPVHLTEQQRCDYRNRDETWSILLTRDTVILQTTAHTLFEDFAERLRMAVHTVLAESEHDRCGRCAELPAKGGGRGAGHPDSGASRSPIPEHADHAGVSE